MNKADESLPDLFLSMLRLLPISTLLLFIFAFWILMGHQEERIAKTCRPIVWLGTGINSVATTMGVSKSTSLDILNETNSVRYTCEKAIWDVLYEQENSGLY